MNRKRRFKAGLRRVFGWLLVSLFIQVLLVSLAFAMEDPRQEMKRLLEEAPSLSSYPAVKALVLSRSVENRLLADGSMERKTRWIILYRGSLPEGWQTWRLPAPEGGTARFVRAERYSVLAIEKADRLGISEGGNGVAVLRIPESSGESILYVETAQVFPRRFELDDLVSLELDLPQWELSIEVTVPEGSRLSWAASGIGQPERSREKGIERFSWNAKNLPPMPKRTLLDRGIPALGFSLKSGLVTSLRTVQDIEKGSSRLPQRLSRLLSGKNPEKTARDFVAALTAGDNMETVLPKESVRTPGGVFPENGPWTEWERTLFAAHGLKSLGWSVRTWWLPAIPVGPEPPAGIALWTSPVLEVSAPRSGQSFFFTARPDGVFGRTPSWLYGATLYRLEGDNVLKTKIPEGSPSGNRLSAKWQLKLDEAGFARGKLLVELKGGWDFLLRDGERSLGERALRLLQDLLSGTPFASGMGELKFSESTSGIEISVPVNGLLGIASQKDLLVQFPSVSIPGIREILEETGTVKLRFPFSVRQELVLELPAGFRVLEPPSLKRRTVGRTAVEETFRNIEKKSRVETEQLVTVSASGFEQNEAAGLKDTLAQVLRWATNSIPLRKR